MSTKQRHGFAFLFRALATAATILNLQAVSLVSLWEFDGTWNSANNPSYNLTPSLGAELVASPYGGAARFSGGEFIGPDNPDLDRADTAIEPTSESFASGLSIMGLLKPASLSNSGILVHDRSSYSLQELGFQVTLSADGALSFMARDTADRRLLAFTDSNVIKPGKWQHFGLTWDGSDSGGIQFYLNGTGVPTTTQFFGFTGLDGDALKVRIGATLGNSAQGVNGFDGDIDHLSLWHDALSADQVKADVPDEGSSAALLLLVLWAGRTLSRISRTRHPFWSLRSCMG